MPKLQMLKQNNTYFLTLPKAIIHAKGWQKGDTINIELDHKGNIILKK